jgi:hypothetical protein
MQTDHNATIPCINVECGNYPDIVDQETGMNKFHRLTYNE